MPCLLVLVILFFPRVVLMLMFLLTDYLGRAFPHGLLVPLLGFIFLPVTTIVYAWEINNHLALQGINLLWLLLAVLLDVSGWAAADIMRGDGDEDVDPRFHGRDAR